MDTSSIDMDLSDLLRKWKLLHLHNHLKGKLKIYVYMLCIKI